MKFNITGRYSIRTNQNRGFMDIIQKKDGTIKGKMSWYMTKGMNNKAQKALTEDTFVGTVEAKIDYKDRLTIEIKFTRNADHLLANRQSEKNPQRYTGWFSDDQNMIAGFYEIYKDKKIGHSGVEGCAYQMPWFADRHIFDIPTKKK